MLPKTNYFSLSPLFRRVLNVKEHADSPKRITETNISNIEVMPVSLLSERG